MPKMSQGIKMPKIKIHMSKMSKTKVHKFKIHAPKILKKFKIHAPKTLKNKTHDMSKIQMPKIHQIKISSRSTSSRCTRSRSKTNYCPRPGPSRTISSLPFGECDAEARDGPPPQYGIV
jgi:hypothetical protein